MIVWNWMTFHKKPIKKAFEEQKSCYDVCVAVVVARTTVDFVDFPHRLIPRRWSVNRWKLNIVFQIWYQTCLFNVSFYPFPLWFTAFVQDNTLECFVVAILQKSSFNSIAKNFEISLKIDRHVLGFDAAEVYAIDYLMRMSLRLRGVKSECKNCF